MKDDAGDDAAQVEAARRGDAEAVAALFRRWFRAARAAAFAVTGDEASAEDAAAQAFEHALRHLGDLREPSRFGAWLRTIAVREARRARSPGRAPAPLGDVDPAAPEAGVGRLEALETAALLRRAVEALPEAQREAISLHYYEGYSVAEAARFLDVPEGTFKRRLHDARVRLRDVAREVVAGRQPADRRRDEVLARIEALLAGGGDGDAFHEAILDALALRPPSHELLTRLLRAHPDVGAELADAGRCAELEERTRQGLERLGAPSTRACDPSHPVGAAAVAIRAALPRFSPWELDPGLEVRRFLERLGPGDPAPGFVLPPGFESGRPCAWVRATRGVLVMGEGGARGLGEAALGAREPLRFALEAIVRGRLSDVLDLLWLEARPLELREVEGLLRQLASEVLPGRTLRVSTHQEPRYRAALRLELEGQPVQGAAGGVLEPFPGLPDGAGAAHVRLFLEPWAALRSGQAIEPVGLDVALRELGPLPATGQPSEEELRAIDLRTREELEDLFREDDDDACDDEEDA